MSLLQTKNELLLALAYIDKAILHTEYIKELQEESTLMSCDPNVAPTLLSLTVSLNHDKINKAREEKNEAISNYADCIKELFNQGARNNARPIGNLIVAKDGTIKAS